MSLPPSLSGRYQRKSEINHVLDAPDTYVGSTETDEVSKWIIKGDGMEYNKVQFNPALYKLFDEVIVNARDHYVRTQTLTNRVKNIKVEIKDNVLSVFNDGEGIDIARHPELDIWIPQLIFSSLRTSTNYDKEEKRIVGGKNGFGVKLVCIYSKWMEIELVDQKRKLIYKQRFENNMTLIHKPVIKKSSKKSYTLIRWSPDYKRFGLDKLSEDMFNLFKKRTQDLSTLTGNVKVRFNGEYIRHIPFLKDINRYAPSVITFKQERWEIGVAPSTFGEFRQVSFVNGINTYKGGKHVDYVINQICRKLVNVIEKKHKTKVRTVLIKEQIMLFINCVIENPSFDSQTKEYLNTKSSKWGSLCTLPETFISKLSKLELVKNAIKKNDLKLLKQSKTDGKKTKHIRGIPKYMPALYAGTKRSGECILILCEGDSAKAGIMSGLSKKDRMTIGVFPLKGKLLNVKGQSFKKINDNKEITSLKKILGLQMDEVYDSTNLNKLRYGRVVFLTDQDLDGSHIKGLCINMFHSLWPSLMKCGFLSYMNTPIIKVTLRGKTIPFYTEQDYLNWKTRNKGGKVKYYKGLGTSTASEFKEYFKNKTILEYIMCEKSFEAIEKVFDRSKSNERKEWLRQYNPNNTLSTVENPTYEKFINKEMIHFSIADCLRSIPNLYDGLKPSTRKILYACRLKLNSEQKVSQVASMVSSCSHYHHGEASLNMAIIKMAQTFVGSNNINLLEPVGQFGSRTAGGSDHASPRYINTRLSPITSYIFRKEDDPILDRVEDGGVQIEPVYFIPIIPFILVNGAVGIGTGFSTEVLCHSPLTLISYIENVLNDKKTAPLQPYYRKFKGKINNNGKKYVFNGCYERKGRVVSVTELPIGIWTDSYKAHLEKLCDKGLVDYYSDMSTDTDVNIEIKLKQDTDKYVKKVTKTNNMYLYTDKLNLYPTVESIIKTFIPVRLDAYRRRKEHILKELQHKLLLISNKARFIKEQLDGELNIMRLKSVKVIKILTERKYDAIDKDFNYLRIMPIHYLEYERYKTLTEEKRLLEKEIKLITKKNIKTMWLEELKELRTQLSK